MKIVLSRLDRVGDLILSTPAIASVRRSWPGAHVTLACSEYNSVVVERNPDVDAIEIVRADDVPAAVGARLGSGCDVAIALAPNAPDWRLVGATRARTRVGYTYQRRYLARATSRLWLTRLGISEADPDVCERDPAFVVRHEVDQLLDLVALAGGTQRRAELVLPVRDDDRAAVAAVPSGCVILHLAARWFRDGSTLDHAVATVAALRALGRPVVVTYGDDSVEEAAVVAAAGVADLVIGKLPFARWAAAFERGSVVVTVDTGATHVASATRRPTVVLFEHRFFNLNSQEWSPYRVPSVCLRKPLVASATALHANRAAIVDAVGTLLASTSNAA